MKSEKTTATRHGTMAEIKHQHYLNNIAGYLRNNRAEECLRAAIEHARQAYLLGEGSCPRQ